MALFIGKVGIFDEAVETWESYSERLEQYFIVNEVPVDKKVAGLLSVIGPRTYNLLKNLTAPDKPADKGFKDLCDLLHAHFNPKPLLIAERFRFHKREQRTDEGIMSFIAELRKLAVHCDFGPALEYTLRDRLVCGLKHENIQKRLLSEPGLTLEKAVKLSVAMETAANDASELQGRVHSVQVNKVRVKRTQNSQVKPKPADQKPKHFRCFRCEGDHLADKCSHKHAVCHYCHRKGHILKACMKKKRDSRGGKVQMIDVEDSDSEPLLHIEVNSVKNSDSHNTPIFVSPVVEGKSLRMELDTGTALSIISEKDYRNSFSSVKLQSCAKVLKSYSGHTLKPLGKISVDVNLNQQQENLDLYIVPQDGPALFGRDWLTRLKLDWVEIKSLHVPKPTSSDAKLQDLLAQYKPLFSEGLGKLKDIKAHLSLEENCQPKFIKARNVPYSLRLKIEEQLKCLERDGVIEPIEHSAWATPIVPSIKRSGEVRICGDYRLTVNPVMLVDKYPLPKIEDIFANLSGGQKFSKVDLRQAYHQCELDDESRDLLVINTHKGLFRYNRLAFGISSAPAIWQRAMDTVLQNIPFTQCMLDDIIVSGRSDDEHLKNLDSVLQRLSSYNLKVNLEKCEFFQSKISYCGHQIDEQGLHKSPDKIIAVTEAPRPGNVTELKAFLGLANYYHRSVPNMSTIAAPLYDLLQADTMWSWNETHEAAFKAVKDAIVSDQVLCHYNPDMPLKLACDASQHGIGCVLSHSFPDGSERPIAFASRTLKKAEKGYSQIDKEALSLTWGVQKFNTYLYGRHFTLVTDHKPLLSIFNPSKSLPSMAAARLQRYALFLSGYSYDIEYKGTKFHGNADALSRSPLDVIDNDAMPDEVDLFYNSQFDTLPVTSEKIRYETQRDLVLSQVLDYVQSGSFPSKNCEVSDDIKPYLNRKHELTSHQGCLLWGNRVIIPSKLRDSVLNELHSGHIGTVKMKAQARSYFWWPKLDDSIEAMCKSCNGCRSESNQAPAAPVHAWTWPGTPWYRLHIDFAGPFKNSMFLIVIDAHSKWPEVFHMRSTTASATIQVLRTLFARQGVPCEIVSDNGPQFKSEEFKHFMAVNNIRHITSSPFHPRTNGQAERFVQSFKKAMKSADNDRMSINQKLCSFLCKYRTTPHSTTNETPSMLMYGRNIRTRLDLLKPKASETVLRKQLQMTNAKHVGSNTRQFAPGQSVIVRDYRQNNRKRCQDKFCPRLDHFLIK